MAPPKGRLYSAPDPRIGYYSGTAPRYGGSGSMAGPKAAGTIAGAGVVNTGDSGWTPTVKFLLILIGAELLAYGALRHYTSHGG